MIKSLAKKLPMPDQPSSAVENLIILVIVVIAAILLVIQANSSRARHRDSERRQDIAALQAKVAEYHALHGYYPKSLRLLNNLKPSICQAPREHGDCTQSDYTYLAFKQDTQPSVSVSSNCDNKKRLCANYIIFTTAMERANNPYFVRSY